jgi:hypothetical protein
MDSGKEMNIAAYQCYHRYGFLLLKKRYILGQDSGEMELYGEMMRPKKGIYENLDFFIDWNGQSLLSHHIIPLSNDDRSSLRYDPDEKNYRLQIKEG